MTWLDQHKQRLVYVLLAVAMLATLVAGTVGGFFLRHAANVERQSLRTQQLAGAAVQLQRFLLQAQAEGVTPRLVATREQALEAADAAFQSVRAHDRAEGDRLQAAFHSYVADSGDDFRRARAGAGHRWSSNEQSIAGSITSNR